MDKIRAFLLFFHIFFKKSSPLLPTITLVYTTLLLHWNTGNINNPLFYKHVWLPSFLFVVYSFYYRKIRQKKKITGIKMSRTVLSVYTLYTFLGCHWLCNSRVGDCCTNNLQRRRLAPLPFMVHPVTSHCTAGVMVCSCFSKRGSTQRESLATQKLDRLECVPKPA